MINKLLSVFQLFVFALNYLKPKSFDEIKFLNKFLPSNSIIFDIGANVGTYSKTLDSFVKKEKLNFYLFEPNPKLIKTLSSKRFKHTNNVSIIDSAVAQSESEEIFYERNISSYSSLKKDNLTENHKIIDEYSVKTIPIDLFCKKNDISKINLLKIDTEGNDFEVLKSASNMFEKNAVEIIKVEILPSTKSFYEILNYLEKFKFQLIGITNLSYLNNKILLFDAYFVHNQKLNNV